MSARTKAARKAPLLLAFLVIAAAWVFPIAWMAITSLKPANSLNSLTPTFAFEPTLHNYFDLFQNRGYGSFLEHSVLVGVGTTGSAMLLACLAAYSLSRMRVRGREQIGLWILSLRMLPPIATVVPFYLILNRVHLLDTYLGLLLVYLSFSLPFAIWMLQGFFSEIPTSLDEAASADGAGPLKILFRIIVPSARAGIAVTALFTFVFAWNEFLFAFLLTRDRWQTLPVLLGATTTPFQTDWGYLTAGAIVALLPLLIVVFLLQREMARGMTFGIVR